MAVVKPFHALHYDPRKVKIEQVIAPPYDIISADDKKVLYQRDPYNVVQLELSIPDPKNPPTQFVYAGTATTLKLWTGEKVLIQDPKEAYYLYEMQYQHPFHNKMLTRLSLFGALKLEPFEQKIVFPHEKTHATAKVDRMQLLKATECNFSPIFALYEDETNTLDQIYQSLKDQPALYDFQDEKGTTHRLWPIQSQKEKENIQKTFQRRRVFIADGHHRYETALNYAIEKNNGTITGNHPWDYVMTSFVRFHDLGLLILPIHRVVLKSTPINREEFKEKLKKYFILHSVSRSVLEKVSEGSITDGFGLAFSDNECFSLELKDKTTARQAMPKEKPAAWHDLDMNLISYLIFEPLLQIKNNELEWKIFYTSSVDEAFGKLKGSDAECAFFIRPVTPRAIKEICESGELMPQKSTYFYPKFPSGLLMYPHQNV